MSVYDVGIRAFDPSDEVRGDEDVENTVDTVRWHAAIVASEDLVSNLVSRRWPPELEQRLVEFLAQLSS